MLSKVQATLVVARVKGLWQDQVADRPTVETWHELLEKLNYDDVIEAVMDRARAGLERPSCADLYRDAAQIRDRRMAARIARIKPLDYRLSDKERAAGKQKLAEIVQSICTRIDERMAAIKADSEKR